MSSASTGGTEGSSPASSPASAASLTMAAPKYGTLVPNRIFVGGISASTSEAELAQLFSAYGNVKATKIISDRAGVSKGYGFVTFETEEEAKRLQQESECIVLRERKLNIAPAIKKQPFNRSFDGGSGSPPSVPTSTYYYANGMGLTYQNGMTFYNAGAAAGTPIAPPTDPTTIYQATGVFGPQAAAGHQTFAPVMYPCPAPSLYMPQQYQYSPMPYEQYYAGTAAAGAPQYAVYGASSSPNNASGSGNNSGNGSNGTGATSPPTAPPPPLASLPPPTHFYAPAAPTPHHHPPVPTGHPPPQMDHLYYSFAAGPPPAIPAHTPMGLNDQQLLLYTTDASCQQNSTSDGQTASQEDSRSTSSHSEQPHGETQAASGSATPLVSLMPVKFPMSNRYTNYHPIAIHAANMHGAQSCLNENEDCSAGQMHCRAIVYHPAAVYIPHTHTPPFHGSTTAGGGSLLPTPPSSASQGFDQSPKIANVPRDPTKLVSGSMQNSYGRSQAHHNAGSFHQSGLAKVPNTGNSNIPSHKHISLDGTPRYPTTPNAPSRLPLHYNKRGVGSTVGSSTCLLTHKTGGYVPSSHKSNNYTPPSSSGGQTYGQGYANHQRNVDYGNTRRTLNYVDQYSESPTANGNRSSKFAYNRRNNAGSYKTGIPVSNAHQESSGGDGHGAGENFANSEVNGNTNSTPGESTGPEKPTSPPPARYSPMTRPVPNVSPPTSQVQFYQPAQNRYQPPLPPSQQQQQQQQQHHQQQQQQQQQPAPPQSGQQPRRYNVASAISNSRKVSEKYSSSGNSQNSMLRQSKYKLNGVMQSAGKVSEEGLGGAGDAPPTVGRMPITPPGTPRSHATDQNQLNDTCHQIQALGL